MVQSLKKLPINKKFFFAMVALSTMIIIVIFVSTCIIVYRYHIKAATTSSMHELGYISKQLDLTLTTVENFSKTILVDTMVQEQTTKYIQKDLFFNDLNKLILKNKIGAIIQGTSFIQSVSLYDADKNLIVTTDTASTLPSIKGIDIEEPMWIAREKMMPYGIKDTLPVLSFMREFYNYDLGLPLGYIEISIFQSAIANIYKEQSTDPYTSQFIVDQYGITQSSDGENKHYQLYGPFDDIIKSTSGYDYAEGKIVFYKYYSKLNWYLIRSVNKTYFYRPIYSLLFIASLITLCCIAIITILSHIIAKTITSPIHHLIAHIQNVIHGNWEPVRAMVASEEITFLTSEFNKMLQAQSKLKDDLIKEQILKQKISLNLLQQQVNPHFLYNALDNICSLAELDEKEKLIEIVMNLSTFYQETLNEGSLLVTVGKELDIIESYLKIMQIRYFNKFDYIIDCPPQVAKRQCLKLLLQPIVENCIYHGIKEVPYKGMIYIRVREDQDGITFTIDDNGIGITPEKIEKVWSPGQHSFSIKNINKRINLYYGPSYGLWIDTNEYEGCTVKVTIGLELEQELGGSIS